MARISRILLIAIPLSAMSIVAGITAYRVVQSLKPDHPEQGDIAPEKQIANEEWPEVPELSSSGVAAAGQKELSVCKQTLQLANEVTAFAHQSNFGKREATDVIGRRIPNVPSLIVLHETVIPAQDTVRLFKTNHENNDDQQSSYHLLISRGGRLIRIVPDSMRAYGSGYSRFGDFTVFSKSPHNFSVNNVSLHISLESPQNAQDGAAGNISYTRDQYSTLAKQVLLWQAQYGIPIFRVTTHASVDRSHSRYDPRGFVWDEFDHYHRQYATMCGLNYLTLPRSS